MPTRKLDKAEWRPFLDGISKLLEAKEVEIEVASLSLGDQVQAKWLPLHGVTYDSKDDMVEVALEGLDHMMILGKSLPQAEREHNFGVRQMRQNVPRAPFARGWRGHGIGDFREHRF